MRVRSWPALVLGALVALYLLLRVPHAGSRLGDQAPVRLEAPCPLDVEGGVVQVVEYRLELRDRVRLQSAPLSVPHAWVGPLDWASMRQLAAQGEDPVLVLTSDPIANWKGELRMGEACGRIAVVNAFPEACPWRWALHEIGHTRGHAHTETGLMSYDDGCPSDWGV